MFWRALQPGSEDPSPPQSCLHECWANFATSQRSKILCYPGKLKSPRAASHRVGRSQRSSGKCSRCLEPKGATALKELERLLGHLSTDYLKAPLGKHLAPASSPGPVQPPQQQHLAHYYNKGLLKYLLCERQLRKSSLALFCLRQKQSLFSKLLLTALSH